MNKLLSRDVYEITTERSIIRNVMLRGRIRKLCIENGKNVIVENDEEDSIVRFAVLHNETTDLIEQYLRSILPDVIIAQIYKAIHNPILSKLKTNDESRYAL